MPDSTNHGDKGPTLAISHASKAYPGVLALDDVSMQVTAGSIHALCGKNGAGKSTLVSAIVGFTQLDSGRIIHRGDEITHLSISAIKRRGIRIVPQHVALVPGMTVAENLFMNDWPSRAGVIRKGSLRSRAEHELAQYGIALDVSKTVQEFGLVDQRKFEIIRALFGESKLIILDEPVAMLEDTDKQHLFDFIRELAATGISIIYTSHNVNELLDLCDHITVLRSGKTVGSFDSSTLSETALTRHIMGSSDFVFSKPPINEHPRRPIAMVNNLCAGQAREVSVELRSHEVLCLVDRIGGGARDFARGLAGIEPMTSGNVAFQGRPPHTMKHPTQSARLGVAMLTHDRHGEGLVLDQSVQKNITLTDLAAVATNGWIITREEKRITNRYIVQFKIKAPTPDTTVKVLSGGNQQKVYLSSRLLRSPRILILDEPTSGVDISGKEDILAAIDNLRSRGLSIIYHTNEFDEALRIADRFAIFANGKIHRFVENTQLTEDDLFRLLQEAEVSMIQSAEVQL